MVITGLQVGIVIVIIFTAVTNVIAAAWGLDSVGWRK